MANGTKQSEWIEFPPKSGIRILTIDNSTLGQKFGISFQVNIPAKVSGKGRIRKQFPAVEEAKQWAAKELRGLKLDGEAYWQLRPQERHEIGKAIRKLKEKGISIQEAVDFALRHLKPSGGERTLSDVINELLESKIKRNEVGDLSHHSLRDFKSRSLRLANDIGKFQINEIHAEQIKEWVSGITGTNRTRMNYLRIASEIFRFAEQKQYLVENPFKFLSDNDRKEIHGRSNLGGNIKCLTVDEAERLLNVAATDYPDFVAVLALGLFCGIRTEELKQLTWDKVDFSRDTVTVGKDIAKKRRIRHVTLPETAKEWLTCGGVKRKATVAPVTGKQFDHRFSEILRAAGFTDESGHSTWPRNGMRHSFGSYHYELFGDAILTAKELGHKANDDVLFNHYRDLVQKGDGEKYFAIKPVEETAKIVEFVG